MKEMEEIKATKIAEETSKTDYLEKLRDVLKTKIEKGEKNIDVLAEAKAVVKEIGEEFQKLDKKEPKTKEDEERILSVGKQGAVINNMDKDVKEIMGEKIKGADGNNLDRPKASLRYIENAIDVLNGKEPVVEQTKAKDEKADKSDKKKEDATAKTEGKTDDTDSKVKEKIKKDVEKEEKDFKDKGAKEYSKQKMEGLNKWLGVAIGVKAIASGNVIGGGAVILGSVGKEGVKDAKEAVSEGLKKINPFKRKKKDGGKEEDDGGDDKKKDKSEDKKENKKDDKKQETNKDGETITPIDYKKTKTDSIPPVKSDSTKNKDTSSVNFDEGTKEEALAAVLGSKGEVAPTAKVVDLEKKIEKSIA